MTVLGIDPGLASMGVAVITERDRVLVPLAYDCIRTLPSQPFPNRLQTLHRSCVRLIKQYRPDVLAMERIFFAKNAKTAIIVGQAQGAILLSVAGKTIDVVQYTPMEVKMAVTGHGTASKADVALMIQKILELVSLPRPDDDADTLAVANCYIATNRLAS